MKKLSNAANLASVCDDNSDDDFITLQGSKERKKATQTKVNWTEKRHLTCKITAMTTKIKKIGQVQKEAQSELKKIQKKMKSL